MDGYYDHHALVSLERHLAIASLVAEDARTVGYRLAALHGLPFTDLDRKIEHHAGRSIWELVASDGAGRYRAMEREQLGRALDDRPFGVISLGDGTLIDDGNRRLVAAEATLVVLDYDLAGSYWRLLTRPASQHDHWHPLHREPLSALEQLRPFVEERREGLARAEHRVEMTGGKLGDALTAVTALLPAGPASG